MPKGFCEFCLFVFTTTFLGDFSAVALSSQSYSRKSVQQPVRQIMLSKKHRTPKKQAIIPVNRHDMLGPGGPLAFGVNEFLTPWPSAAYITNTTHPLMIKILLGVVAPILCVLIALQAYVTYFGPSNSYDGSWTVPLSDPAAPGIATSG